MTSARKQGHALLGDPMQTGSVHLHAQRRSTAHWLLALLAGSTRQKGRADVHPGSLAVLGLR